MAQGLVDEPAEKDGARLAEDRRPNHVAEDVAYDLQSRRRVSHDPHIVGARGMAPLILTRYTLVSALGKGLDETYRHCGIGGPDCGRDFEDVLLTTYIGRVDGVDEVFVGGDSASPELEQFDCRNNRLALLGLQQDGFIQAAIEARERYGAHRVAVILGSSTSGILETEHAYCHRDAATGALPSSYLAAHRYTHNMFSAAHFVRTYLGLRGRRWSSPRPARPARKPLRRRHDSSRPDSAMRR